VTPTTFRYEVDDHVATLTFTRPERRNSFTMAMCLELAAAFDEADADDDVRVIIVTGEGRSFCAGADLAEGFIGADSGGSPEVDHYLAETGTIHGVPRDGGGWLTLRIARSPKLVIAAFNGSAVGVGVTMTLPMDIRIAAEGTRLGLVFARRGLVPEAASSWFLPRLVGVSKAVEWVATGRLVEMPEALDAGLVSYVVPPDQLLAKAREIAAEVVSGTSPVAVAAGKRLLWSMLSAESPWDAHALDSQAIYHLSTQPDVAEGVGSFLEKRPAEFPMTVSADFPDYLPDWPERPERHPEGTTEGAR
jgi:enoyl-CoA hydratase/carnithine racemase